MQRAVLTLLVGLMLLLGGGASALTFKSDGSVVQSDGTVLKEIKVKDLTNEKLCSLATRQKSELEILGVPLSAKRVWRTENASQKYLEEAKSRGMRCGTGTFPTLNSTSFEEAELYWYPSEFRYFECDLEIPSTSRYAKKIVASYLQKRLNIF